MSSASRTRLGAIGSVVACAGCALGPAISPAAADGRGSDDRLASKPPGLVLSDQPLPRRLWIPEVTRRAYRVRYVTTNALGERAPSTGAIFIPRRRPPRGGWPVIAWAHGTVGLGDRCAPSRIGPLLPDRDLPYLARWMREGYAVVASDYVGLGTPGLMAYLHGRSTAHSVVDMVKAAGRHSRASLPRTRRLSNRWVAIGQSQGAGGAIYTARHANAFGGRQLDYRGAVGTGTPANIERLMLLPGPGVPPVDALPPSIKVYISYIFTSLRYVHPELGIDAILTGTGRRYLDLAETACPFELEKALAGVNVGDYFTRPVATLPGMAETLRKYMGMPEEGFDRPFFMGHGLRDLDVPYASTAAYVAALTANGEPVTFRTYANDHSGTMLESQRDTIPFVRRLFARD